MTKLLRRGLSASLLLMVSISAAAQQQQLSALDSVVTIYTTRSHGPSEQGSGFFFKDSATVATAYHVIREGDSFRIVTRSLTKVDSPMVSVIRYDSEKDIALLHVNLSDAPAPLNADDRVSPPTEPLLLGGSGTGVLGDAYIVHLTTQNLVPATTFNDEAGEKLFDSPGSLNLLRLTGPVYSGVSGGPLISSSGRVLGVLSGSLAQGGPLAWAIPISRLVELSSRPQMTQTEIAKWPTNNFNGVHQRGLTNYFTLDDHTADALNQFLVNNAKLSATNERIPANSSIVAITCGQTSTTLDSYLSNSTLPPEKSSYSMEDPTMQTARLTYSVTLPRLLSLRDDLKLRDELEISLRTAMQRLTQIGNRKDLTAEEGQDAEQAAKEIQQSQPDIAASTFELRQGINTDQLLSDLDELVAHKDLSFGSLAEAKGFSEALKRTDDALSKYGNGDFVIYSTNEETYIRSAVPLLERYYAVAVYVPE